MPIPWEDIIKIVTAFVAGGLLGVEREYSDKPAGLRTMIMITVGSTLFAMLSLSIRSESPDRIASNIVTGVGFVGAGVIFKEGLNIRGITTAATIWVAAAVGMALGFGEYILAFVTLFLVMVTLTLLSRLENNIDRRIQTQIFRVSFRFDEYSIPQLEQQLQSMNIGFERISLEKKEQEISVGYKIGLPLEKNKELIAFFMQSQFIKRFEG